MASLDDLRRIALSFPAVEEQARTQGGGVGWRTAGGLFVLVRTPRKTDLAQLADLGRSWPDGTVIAVRTEDFGAVEALLAGEPEVFFTIPHFAGSATVLARLDALTVDRLAEVVTEAWLTRASQPVAKTWLAEHPVVEAG